MFTHIPTVLYGSMEYAKTLVPVSIKRSVSTVQSAITQRMLSPLEPRPYKVCTQNRLKTKVFLATSLNDLLEKVASSFLLTCQFLTLVLEEDGTLVDSETLFCSLPSNTLFMVMEKGEVWTHNFPVMTNLSQPKRNGIARVSFDLYKMNPADFLGCLTVRATLYEMYSLSYDIKCTGFKYFLKSVLRWIMQMARIVAQVLLYGSTHVLQYIGDDRS